MMSCDVIHTNKLAHHSLCLTSVTWSILIQCVMQSQAAFDGMG